MEPEVNDRAYQIGIVNSNRQRIHSVLKTDSEEATQVVNGLHWIAEIEKGQADSEIATLKVEEEVRLRLYVPK